MGYARVNLNNTVFFGISDYWNTTICLFHKELNGPGPRPSEYINVRRGALTAAGPHGKHRNSSELVTAHELAVITRGTQLDVQLYREALAHFTARAEKFGCPMVPSSG